MLSSDSSKVAIPPSVANQDPQAPLPASLQSSLLAALYSSPDTIPRLQTALRTSLDSAPPNTPHAETDISFSGQLHNILLSVLRGGNASLHDPSAEADVYPTTNADQSLSVRRDATGSLQVDEAALSEHVMNAVRRAREPGSRTSIAKLSQGEGQAQHRLALDERIRQEILRVVREELRRVAIVRDEGVDTPFGRMY